MTRTQTSPDKKKNQTTADERLKMWQSSRCPYCGGTTTHRADTRKVVGGKVTGVHFKCLNDKCKAENFFSAPRHLDLISREEE